MLRCFGPAGVLQHGVLHGWWGADAAAAAAAAEEEEGTGSGAGVSVTRPAQCQAKCAETDGCAWFTLLALKKDGGSGGGGGGGSGGGGSGGALCLLHAAIGKHGATTMTPTTTTGSLPGEEVQVDPTIPKLKPPGTQHLKLKCADSLSTFAFNFSLRCYTPAP